MTAVRTVLKDKYADFSGRARRSEFWWFALFSFAANLVATFIFGMIGLGFVAYIVSLALLVPGIAVAVRRLHDRDMIGWWCLIALVPLVGGIALLVICALEGTKGPNKYGADPAA
ncbi:DUF805 domain-containing protein [Loktanella agnita]|uniref:DUF805 domain-containing protein n=1 Tax=Loktanella agnita TaxID=287097 RepID=UPI003985FDC1